MAWEQQSVVIRAKDILNSFTHAHTTFMFQPQLQQRGGPCDVTMMAHNLWSLQHGCKIHAAWSLPIYEEAQLDVTDRTAFGTV